LVLKVAGNLSILRLCVRSDCHKVAAEFLTAVPYITWNSHPIVESLEGPPYEVAFESWGRSIHGNRLVIRNQHPQTRSKAEEASYAAVSEFRDDACLLNDEQGGIVGTEHGCISEDEPVTQVEGREICTGCRSCTSSLPNPPIMPGRDI
jgi:hypothetical protein